MPDKLNRWLDLLAALLVRQLPAPFDDLERDVPAYRDAGRSARARASVKRTFERDKDELRAFGVPIESLMDEDGVTSLYRLRHADFYLPYLSLTAESGASGTQRRIDRYGYRALPHVAFEPDELAAIADAAARVETIGDAALAAEARTAMRKLAADLDIAAAATEAVHNLAPRRGAHDTRVFEATADAVARRKNLTFDYVSMERGSTDRRQVQPYGLFFLGAHWYLAAHDLDRRALRNFRLSRMRGAKANAARPNTPDFDIPKRFDLRAHARSGQAWELGDDDAVDVAVRFTGATGAVEAARTLGRSVPGEGDVRRFRVRRPQVFARWLLTFGGDATPLEPASFVELYRTLVRDTLAVYA